MNGQVKYRDLIEKVGRDTFFDAVNKMSEAEAEAILYDWRGWARDNQILPDTNHSIYLLLAGRGFGKALALDTPILTADGWSTMGELETGDIVADEHGEYCMVEKAHDVLYDRDCFEVRFSDGERIVADSEHLWRIELEAFPDRYFTLETHRIKHAIEKHSHKCSILCPEVDGLQARRVTIEEIIAVDSVPVRCITVDSPSRLYLAGNNCIPTHNTRTAAEWVREQVQRGAGHIALVAQSAADARGVMVEGESGILAVHPKRDRPVYEPSKRRVEWANGARATIFTAEDPEQLRGPSHDTAWVDEMASYGRNKIEDVWSNLMLGLRLGRSQCAVTTTPKPIKLLKDLIQRDDVYIIRGSTYDNFANLSKTFREQIISQYEGTRIGRQELNAEILDDVEGALWNYDILSKVRISTAPDNIIRKAVGVDPSGSSTGDEAGICVAGIDSDKVGYLLGDYSVQGSPREWAQIAVDTFHNFDADIIVAEKNQGGEMVEHTIHTIDPNVPVKLIHASQGKILRAEPIAALYEQERIKHVGTFSKLEDEMCIYDGSGPSPNRLDAAVYALRELMLGRNKSRSILWGSAA